MELELIMPNYEYFPINGIGTHETDRLLEWLEEYREPDLWHQMMFSLNFDASNTMDYVLWFVQQPDCDIATAVSAFSMTYAFECVYTETRPYDDRVFDLAEIICNNSEKGYYTRSEIGGVDNMLDISPSGVLQKISKACEVLLQKNQEPYLPIPQKILTEKYPEKYNKTPYFVDESAVVRIDSMGEEARRILGYQ